MSASEHSAVNGRPWIWYLAATLAATGVSLLLPTASPAWTAIFLAVNASVIGAFAWGIRRYRPVPRTPWLVLGAGYALTLAAIAMRHGLANPSAPLTDEPASGSLYLLAYVVIAVGLVLLVRARGASRDLPALMDATVAVIGIAIVWFEFLIAPFLERPGIAAAERLVVITYPVPDLLFLIFILWLAFAKGPRTTALLLLGGGVLAQAAADGLLGISDLGQGQTGAAQGLLRLLSLALAGASALHPSMPMVGAPGDQPPWFGVNRRIYLIAAVGLLVPLSLLRESLRTGSAGGVVFAIALIGLLALLVVRVRGLFVDVDTYARSVARLTEAEARFRRLVERVPVVIYIDATDKAAASRYLSPRWQELTGYSSEEVAAHHWLWLDHIHPDDREWVVAASDRADEQDDPRALVYRIVAADGRELWVRDEETVIERDAEGRASAWQGILADVTEAHRASDEIRRLNDDLEQRIAERTAELTAANEQLRQANGYLERIISAVPVILYQASGPDCEVHDETEYVNTGADRMLGFSLAEATTPGFWIERVHPEDRARASAEVLEVRRRRLPVHSLEYRMVHRDGHVLWMHDVARYQYEADGAWTSAGAVIDVTEQKGVEDDLRQAKEEAEIANRAKSDFLSSMSHELRTPLNSILGFGQLLERSVLSPDDRDSVSQVLRGGRTLLTMIDSVLDLAHVESGRLTLSIEPVSVGELISETVDLVGPMAAGRGIRLVTPDVEPRPWVLADRRRIKQVMLSLLRNAVTYNRDDGSVTIACHVAAGDRLRISVTDTGPGIPAEHQATLFTILGRRIGSDRKPGGLGVGLALSARLIEAMNGSISVHSEVGTGSTFSIELPLAAEPAVGPGERSAEGAGAPAGVTVVYVEDNLANLKLVERILDARPRTRVLAAMQGRLGLDLARQHHPDLVLLDLHLPDMLGEEVLRLLQGDPATREIPVIVLSSASGNGSGQRLLDLGAEAYLAKPIDVAAFLATVDRVLQGGVAHA